MAKQGGSKSLVPFHMQDILCDFIFRIIDLTLTSLQLFGLCNSALFVW